MGYAPSTQRWSVTKQSFSLSRSLTLLLFLFDREALVSTSTFYVGCILNWIVVVSRTEMSVIDDLFHFFSRLLFQGGLDLCSTWFGFHFQNCDGLPLINTYYVLNERHDPTITRRTAEKSPDPRKERQSHIHNPLSRQLVSWNLHHTNFQLFRVRSACSSRILIIEHFAIAGNIKRCRPCSFHQIRIHAAELHSFAGRRSILIEQCGNGSDSVVNVSQ